MVAHTPPSVIDTTAPSSARCASACNVAGGVRQEGQSLYRVSLIAPITSRLICNRSTYGGVLESERRKQATRKAPPHDNKKASSPSLLHFEIASADESWLFPLLLPSLGKTCSIIVAGFETRFFDLPLLLFFLSSSSSSSSPSVQEMKPTI